MQFLSIQRLLGVLLALFSTTMIPPMVVSWYYEDGSLLAFLSALLFILCSGLALWLQARHVRRDLRVRDGFIVVVMFWTALGLSGSLPLMLADRPHMPPADAGPIGK